MSEKKEKKKRRSGILLHPTSLPSKYGIGDLGKTSLDFVDFLEKANQRVWQILPLGHTSFGDSPYQSFSAFAGNPLLISPDELLADKLLKEEDLQNVPGFSDIKTEFGRVIEYKYGLFRKAFAKFKTLRGKKVLSDYSSFCESNKYWLDDYCLFISLKNHFIEERRESWETPEYKAYKKANSDTLSENAINDCFYGACWNSWPSDIAQRKKAAIEKWSKTLKSEINFYKFLQYKFYSQWKKVKEYANSKGIEIIGDIPIFVAADSADSWSNPKLFKMTSKGYPTEVAGVPPDYFSKTGQLWGNPLYNWDYHWKTNYEWWTERIRNTLNTVDILRIDHFRAFESYWAIPYGSETAETGEWKKGPGAEIFQAIEKSIPNLPIIAEDLGDLNKEVIELRDKLGFPGMKILQFAFGGGKENLYLPHNYTTTNSVVYTGTHDNDTTLGWYSKTDDKTKDHLRRVLNISGDDISWDLIRCAFASVADIAIIPLQDVLCLDSSARMNEPGTSEGNWQFRFREGLLTDEKAEGLAYFTDLYNR